MMSKKKRKNRGSSGSESDDHKNKGKFFKPGSPGNDNTEPVVVSELLSQTNSILYSPSGLINDTGDTRGDTCETSNLASPLIPSSNSPKMAEGGVPAKVNKPSEENSISAKLDTLINVVSDLKNSQDNMKRMFESKLDKLKSDLIQNVDTKVQALRNELSLDIGKETARIDSLMANIQAVQNRLEGLEHATPTGIVNDVQAQSHTIHADRIENTDMSITVSGIPVSESENLVEKAEGIIRALGEDVSSNVRVTAAARLPSRFKDRPEIVKVSVQSVEAKVMVLRNKWKLKDSVDYKKVYIQSSKSRTERLIEFNTRAILRSLPGGRSLRIDGTGRIKPRNPDQQQEHRPPQDQRPQNQ